MILHAETLIEYGYLPMDLKLKSAKPILAACNECGKVRETTKYLYRALCSSCSKKGNQNHFGYKHTEDAKALISAAAIKRIHNSPPAMTAPEKIFDSIREKCNLPFVCNVNAKKHIGKREDAEAFVMHLMRKERVI